MSCTGKRTKDELSIAVWNCRSKGNVKETGSAWKNARQANMRRLVSSMHAEFHQPLADGIIDYKEVAVEGDFGRRGDARLS